MTGLDKIISQILDDAGKEADEALEKARNEAEEIIRQAEEECGRAKEEGRKKLSADSAAYRERMRSSAELKKRQAVLLAKQQVIAGLLNQAYEALLSKGDAEYFGLIQKMLTTFVPAKQGEIYFSQRDLNRMPEGFETVIRETAGQKGGSLKLSGEPKNIDGGFILVYGGVEENCTFKALLAARKDELSDRVHELLFL